MPHPFPVFDRLRELAHQRPVVVAHRGASATHPENTLTAFAAARDLGVRMQEFDVRATRDDVLVCVHDETFDRTSDASRRLGPGALVAQLRQSQVATLDAGAWKNPRFTGERVPTLAAAIATMGPDTIPLIEHKAGAAELFVRTIAEFTATTSCILQSFDWDFLTRARQRSATLALALLGPTPSCPRLDADAIRAGITLGAGMLHWHANALTRTDIARAHEAGLLICSYTTDDELGWAGGEKLGLDAMCTNVPSLMLTAQHT